jgi:hypothetical protein
VLLWLSPEGLSPLWGFSPNNKLHIFATIFHQHAITHLLHNGFALGTLYSLVIFPCSGFCSFVPKKHLGENFSQVGFP